MACRSTRGQHSRSNWPVILRYTRPSTRSALLAASGLFDRRLKRNLQAAPPNNFLLAIPRRDLDVETIMRQRPSISPLARQYVSNRLAWNSQHYLKSRPSTSRHPGWRASVRCCRGGADDYACSSCRYRHLRAGPDPRHVSDDMAADPVEGLVPSPHCAGTSNSASTVSTGLIKPIAVAVCGSRSSAVGLRLDAADAGHVLT